MTDRYSVHVLCGVGGWYVEWYTDDDGGSGYGDHSRVCYWYAGRQGGRAACEARAKLPPPAWRHWYQNTGEGAAPYDAATAAGMYDH